MSVTIPVVISLTIVICIKLFD